MRRRPTAPAELAAASVIVLVAAVRYGKHLPEADRFLAAYGRWLRRRRWRWPRSISPPANPKRPRRPAMLICARRSRAIACAGFGRRLCRAARLSALQLAGSPDHPLHHAADGRTDRPGDQHRIHVLAGGRRIRRPHRRIAAALIAATHALLHTSSAMVNHSDTGPAMAAHAAWVASCQGGNKRTSTAARSAERVSTIPAATKPSRPKMGG